MRCSRYNSYSLDVLYEYEHSERHPPLHGSSRLAPFWERRARDFLRGQLNFHFEHRWISGIKHLSVVCDLVHSASYIYLHTWRIIYERALRRAINVDLAWPTSNAGRFFHSTRSDCNNPTSRARNGPNKRTILCVAVEVCALERVESKIGDFSHRRLDRKADASSISSALKRAHIRPYPRGMHVAKSGSRLFQR